MKHTWVCGVLAVFAAFQIGCRSNPTGSPDYGHWGALEHNDYDLQQALVYALQDEQLAQAEYQYVNGTFGNPAPFTCIVNVEGVHVSALEALLTQRGWPVPPNTASEYVVTVGSLGQAYEVGVGAEDANIAMHDKFLTRSDLPADVRSVLENLRNASVCHRNAFQRR
jgi:hypothetical protein